MFINKVKRIIDKVFIQKQEEIPFIVLLSFLMTFVITRLYIYVTNHDIVELDFLISQVVINGVHIHHLNFGIVILSVVGFLSLYDRSRVAHRRLAVFYGIGLGLTFDEFALWFKLTSDYYSKITYDAIIIISLIFLNIIYFPGFWNRLGRPIKKLVLHYTKKGLIKAR